MHHRALDARVRLVGDRAVEGRYGGRVPRLEHRLRRLGAGTRVGGEQPEAAECSVDRAADRVVDPHRLEGAGGHLGRRRAGQGVAPGSVGALDEQRVVGACVECPALQGRDHRNRARAAGQGELLHAAASVIEPARADGRERLVGRFGARRAGEEQQQEAENETAGHGVSRESTPRSVYFAAPPPHLPSLTL